MQHLQCAMVNVITYASWKGSDQDAGLAWSCLDQVNGISRVSGVLACRASSPIQAEARALLFLCRIWLTGMSHASRSLWIVDDLFRP